MTTAPETRDRGPQEPQLAEAIEFDLPNDGSTIQARRGIYVENTETLVISTMRTVSGVLRIDLEAYSLWQIAGQWKVTKEDDTRAVYMTTATTCNCQRFANVKNCKHAAAVRQIEQRKNVAANADRDIYAEIPFGGESDFTRAEGEW